MVSLISVISTQSTQRTPVVSVVLDCSQSPILPYDRRDRARLTVNGAHLDSQVRRGTTENQDGRQ